MELKFTKCLKFCKLLISFNRTAYGIEMEIKSGNLDKEAMLLIAPLMELKYYCRYDYLPIHYNF